jgi:hypothetical protein
MAILDCAFNRGGALPRDVTGQRLEAVCWSDADRQRLLDAMAHGRDLHLTRIFLVCLMPNHIHLPLETLRGNLSAFMR